MTTCVEERCTPSCCEGRGTSTNLFHTSLSAAGVGPRRWEYCIVQLSQRRLSAPILTRFVLVRLQAAAAVEVFQKTWSSLSFPVRLGRWGELGFNVRHREAFLQAVLLQLEKASWVTHFPEARLTDSQVSSVYFISRRSYNEPFQVRWAVPLGPSPAAPKELNLRYLARPSCPGGKDIWEFGRKRPDVTSVKKSVKVYSQVGLAVKLSCLTMGAMLFPIFGASKLPLGPPACCSSLWSV